MSLLTVFMNSLRTDMTFNRSKENVSKYSHSTLALTHYARSLNMLANSTVKD